MQYFSFFQRTRKNTRRTWGYTIILLFGFAANLQAATLTVTNANDSGTGSLREILSIASADDTIEFNTGGADTITLGSVLFTITADNLTIDGSNSGNPIILDGGGSLHALSIGGGATTFTLKNITLQNATETDGGAIFFNPALTTRTLSLDGVTFQNNIAMDAGGAICFAFGNSIPIILSNAGTTVFSGNSAANLGGAIHTSCELTLENTGSLTFTGNAATGATGQGGALHVGGNLTIGAGVSFGGSLTTDGNSAYDGGAIYLGAAATQLSLNGTTFETNSADQRGGAIYFANTTASTLTNSGTTTFVGNTAVGTGGVIYAVGALTLTNTDGGTLTFTENSSEFIGGAIYAGGNVTVGSGVSFADNVAEQGAAIYMHGSTLTLNGTTFQNNSANVYGGAVEFAHPDSILAFSGTTTFSGNTVTSDGIICYGGAIDASGSLTLTNLGGGTLTFTGNKATGATGQGGAIRATKNMSVGSGVTFGGSNITDGNSAFNGGAIYLGNTATQLSLNGTTFQNNKATDQGGAIHASNSAFTLTNSGSTTLSSNSAVSGGAIYSGSAATITNSGTLAFASNTASDKGGAIFANGNLTIGSGVTFGGALTTDANSAYQGGVIFLASSATQLSLDGTTFQNNSATNLGGAICLANTGDVTLTNLGTTSFISNTATDYGGAIYSGGNLSIGSGVTFGGANDADGNSAEWGGAIFLSSAATGLTLDGTTFQNNSATDLGGAVFFGTTNAVTLTNTGNTSFADNTATSYGGAIYVNGALTLANTGGGTITFSGNKNTNVNKGGGSIYANGNVNIGSGVTFGGSNAADGNSADRGGAIYLGTSATQLTLSGTTFQNNKATSSGGAVYLANTGTVTLTNTGNTSFSDNTLSGTYGTGGAIHAAASLTINNSGALTFSGNNAGTDGMGGAIYAHGSLQIQDADFFDNEAGDLGGAISIGAYSANSTSTIGVSAGKTSTFSGNKDGNVNNTDGANAIDIYATSGLTAALNFGVAADALLDMQDPFSGLSEAGALISLAKTGAGTMKLGGVNRLESVGTGYSTFTVSGGKLELYDNTGILLDGTGTAFSVANAVIKSTGLAAIKAQTFTLESATLEYDLAASNVSGKIDVTGTVVHADADNKINLTSWQTGTFTLMTATGGGIDKASFSSVTLNNANLTGRQYASLATSTNNSLILTTVSSNLGLTWSGNSGDWNTTATNTVWSGGNYFQNLDLVNFTASNAGAVTVQNGGVSVAGMNVTGGIYSFTGGKITGTTSGIAGTGITPTGKLEISGGQATMTNIDLDFENDVEVNAGKLILGTGATLVSNGSLYVNGAMEISGGGRADMSSAVNMGRSPGDQGTVTVSGTGSRLEGIALYVGLGGDGDLTFDNQATGTFGDIYIGTAPTSNGTLTVKTGSSLTATTMTIGSGGAAVAAGSGTITAAGVSIGSNGIIAPGDASGATGTLSFVGDVLFDAATLNLDLGSSNVSDKIAVTGTVSYGVNNLVNLTTWNVGTFTILSASNGTIDPGKFSVDSTSFGSRQSATLSISGNDLKLTTSSTGNLDLVWTGISGGNWNTTATGNWANNETFNPDDYVKFDANGTSRSVTVGNGTGVQVSGMEIGGGDYVFSGNVIRGVVSTATGQTVTGKLLLSGGSATFNNTLDFANGIDIRAGATLELGDTGAFAGTMAIANAGTLLFNRTATDYTLGNNVTETGIVRKTGVKRLTLDAVSMSGTFEQAGGDVRLADGRTWAGSYTQQNTAGAFQAGDGTAIAGNASFTKTLEVDGTITVGSLALDGAILSIGLFTGNISDKIVSSGVAALGNVSTIELSAWETGTFTLISASGGLDLSKFVVDSSSFGSRQSAVLSGTANALVLTTSNSGNLDLVWTGATSGYWNTTATGNWTDGEMFNPDDHVRFDETAVTKNIVVGNGLGVQVAGMEISGGNYVFSGDEIRGVATAASAGQTVTGKLVVSGGSAIFENAVDFVNGLEIRGGATVELSDGGIFADTTAVANAGTMRFAHSAAYTQGGDLTGSGSVAKTGTGRLTLDAANMSGNFMQQRGEVELAAGRTWNGNYVQQNGTFTAGSGATLRGAATFAGTVKLAGLLHLDGATVFSGGSARWIGSGSLETAAGSGTVRFENGATISPGITSAATNMTVAGNLHLDGAVLSVDLTSGNVSDSVTVTGRVSFGNNVNTVNLNNWETGLFTILSASSIDPIDGKWTMRYGGATVDGTKARLRLDGGRLMLETDYLPTPERIIVEWDGAVSGDPQGIVWDKNSVADGVFVVVDLPETNLITLDGEVSVLAGMEIRTDVVIRPARKDDTGTVIHGMPNPELELLESNGRLAIYGGEVELDLDTDFANGNLLSGGNVIPGRDRTFGTFEQNADDIENSRGQIIVQDDAEAKISPKKSLHVQNRYIVKNGAELTLDVAEGEELTVRNVDVSDPTGSGEHLLNGGAIILLAGSTLILDGNINITGNSTEMAGGGIFVDPATVVFDSTKGHTAIFDNADESGLNAVALEGAGNELRFVGGTKALSGGVDIRDSVRVLPGSTDNLVNISYTDPADFVQFGRAKHELGDSSLVSVGKGIMRLVEGATFDAGNGGKIDIAAEGTLAGAGTSIATNISVRGSLSPDKAALTATSSIIGSDKQVGTMTLEGDLELDGGRIAVELKRNNAADLVDVKGNLTYGLTGSDVDVNSWSEGTFTVLKSTTASDVDDDRFTLKFGGEAAGSRQNAALFKTGNLLQVRTGMNDADRRRLIWTSTADMFLGTSSTGNWQDDFGQAERFNHTDYLVFNASGNQGTVTLGNADGSTGGRTVSGMLVSDGNYTFTGGDLFGVRSVFVQGSLTEEVGGDLLVGGGNVGFENNVFFEGNIEIRNKANVTLSGRKAFHAEGDFVLSDTASLTLDVGDDLIKGRTVTLDGAVTLTNEPLPTTHRSPRYYNMIVATDGGLDAQRFQSLFNFTEGLLNRWAMTSSDGTSVDLLYAATPLAEYAAANGFTRNETEIARYLQEMFNNWEWEEFELDLMKMNDAQLDALFTLLSNVSIHAEAKTMALSNPYRAVARHFFEWEADAGTCDPRHRRCCSTDGFWFAAYHGDRRQDGDGQARRYGVSRPGMNLGVDKRITRSFHVGALFGYADPRLYQEGSRIEADDYTIGAYAKKRFNDRWEANAFVAYGNQDYDGRRITPDGSARSNYGGDAWFATAELVRRLRLSKEFTFLPTWAIEFQGARTDAFKEKGSEFRQVYEKSDLSQTVMRFGLNSQWRLSDRARLDTRLQYGRQIGGGDLPCTRSVFATSSVDTPMTLGGVKIGRDQLNVGVGGRYFLGKFRRSLVYGNYDLDRGNRSLAHTGEIGFQHFY